MTRYFVFLSYRGENYHGWQIQPNAPTVQQELNKVFSLLLREEIMLTGAGRTDTGVHAKNFVAHFESRDVSLHTNKSLIRKMNSFLSKHIVVHEIKKVIPEAHARFDAQSRIYEYIIKLEKDPFSIGKCWFYFKEPDVEKMNEAASKLLITKDFKAFCKMHDDINSTICQVKRAVWQKNGNTLVFTIEADRFLRNMVRSIVGTLMDVGLGKISCNQFENIILSKNRSKAGVSVPAQGLFLSKILYPEKLFV